MGEEGEESKKKERDICTDVLIDARQNHFGISLSLIVKFLILYVSYRNSLNYDYHLFQMMSTVILDI